MDDTLLTNLSELSLYFLGAGAINFLPVLLLIFITYIQIRLWRLNISIVAALLMVFPACSPLFSDVLGYDHYTYMNWDLQDSPTIVAAAVFLVCMFTSAFCVGAFIIPAGKHVLSSRLSRVKFSKFAIVIAFSINFFLLLFFLEAGNIVTSAYSDFKIKGAAPFSSLVNQIFNVSVAIFLSFVGKGDRNRLIILVYIIFISLALILSRRTLALSLVMLAGFTLQENKLSLKQIVALVGAAFLLWFIGEARKVGILSYLSGARPMNVNEFILGLPGGASNIFVSVLGVVDAFARGLISGWDKFPIIFWFADTTELQIYGALPYAYNGGMHIASVFYWNFGLLGVLVGGLLLGIVSQRVQIIVSDRSGLMDGTLKRMLSFAFILTLPNLIWYHPIGMIKLTLAVTFGFIALTVIKRATKPLSSGGSSIGKSRAHR